LEAIKIYGMGGYRRLRKRYGLAADWRLFRHGIAAVARNPKLLLRRSQYRDTLKTVTARTKLDLINMRTAKAKPDLAGRDDLPDSHAARMAAIEADAAEYAAKHSSVTPVEIPKVFIEDGVDPNDRQGHFESLFDNEDPWNYGSAYEQQKYERQLAILPEGPIGRALELGCAEGHFTVQLAPRVGHLLATDISTKALARTQARCAALGNIDYQVLDFSVGPIPGEMDLIVCSETLYYLADEAELRKIAPTIVAALRPGGRIVMAHAHAVKDDMTRTGFDWDSIYGVDVINRVFSALPGLALERSLDTELYRIDRFRRVEAGETVPAPMIETAPLVDQLEREVARSVIWGGAVVLRTDMRMKEQRSHVPILMYHGVSDDGPEELARYRVSPALFKAQMRWLRANGFYGIGSEELLSHLGSGRPFAGRPVMITFDDGFQDFADNAWPILLAHDFTAEMFIVTDRAGQTAIWDADKGPPTPLMDGATIARLAAEGVLFGSHTATHRPMDGLSSLEMVEELAGSRAMLAQWLGRPPVSFAPPFSISDSRLGWVAMQCGYKIGLGGEGGVARLGMNPLDLPRIEVRGDRTLDDFVRLMEATL
jgi:peptidoglycan/xylan/chitin deacetylase (PgdA/CDA1 family)/SAM-dependent methyltransferase